MADFITLTCPSCGGKLEITKDAERFTCAYCGQEHLVKRNSGNVSAPAISKPPIVDEQQKAKAKAAAQALVRLQQEIGDLQAQRTNLLKLNPRPVNNPLWIVLILFGCLAPSFILESLGLFSFQSTQASYVVIIGILFGFALALVGVVRLIFFRPNTKQWDDTIGVQLKSMDQQIAAKMTEKAQNQEIAWR